MKNLYLAIILVILAILSLFVGVSEISFLDLFNLTEDQVTIMKVSRLPRLISIIVAGASMAISGLIMQQITRNKFVSPTTAATMDSARLGVLVSLLLFSSSSIFTRMIVSFAFALAGTIVFVKILKKVKVKNKVIIPLVGIMLGNIINSITTFFAYRHDLIQNVSSWLEGDFSMIISGRYELLYISIPLLTLAYFYANKFTVAGMGENFSKNLGLNYNRVVNIGLTIVALSTALVVIIVGRIPFLGLIIPNIVTIYSGDHLKKNLMTTALLGSVFLLFCDILGRVIIYPYEISIGLTVGVIGSIVFLYLVLRGDK
ncbi:iron chelate uptake ABC transporter family permease subunit [Proteinivorax tanatarense]|uniref:Iron chelate uptake ABC transporter family permease subunit n=1 Tax=Proteinivorax tanatarense TaxID=1260629 RepID=A0AAU7VN00_9FIRM